MNEKLICLVVAAIFLLPTVNCTSGSVKADLGGFTEHLGSGIGDTINGNTVITRDTLSHAAWAVSSTDSKSNNQGTLSYTNDKSVSDGAGNTTLTHLGITKAKSYTYGQSTSNSGSFVGAAEFLDVTGALLINAGAKVNGVNATDPDVGVSTTVALGDLHEYNNMAIASANLGYAFQKFDTAKGNIQCDSVAHTLSSSYSPPLEQSNKPEASISTNATGSITNYEDGIEISSSGISIEQNAGILGTFISTSIAGTKSITRTSNYGTKYDLDMQAKAASNGQPSVSGTLVYYISPSQVVQEAVDASQPGDTITLDSGYYNQSVNINKPVIVRGQGVMGSITDKGAIINNNGGKNYVNSKEVFIRADDYAGYNVGWQWLTDLVNSEGIKATISVIPEYAITDIDGVHDVTSIAALQSLSKNNFELADHGLTHEDFTGYDYTAQYNLLSQATNIMDEYWYRPRTFVAPFGNANSDTLAAAKSLGYHTIVSGSRISGDGSINQIVVSRCMYEFFGNHGDPTAIHTTFEEFKTAFDNSTGNEFVILLHPSQFIGDPHGQEEFKRSVEYLKQKNVEFLTMDQAYRYGVSYKY